MWVEESELDMIKRNDAAPPPSAVKKKEMPPEAPSRAEKMSRDHASYFKNGKRYFFEGDFQEALRYFENAYRLVHKPEYYLFMAKCHRKLGDTKRMLFVLDAILQLYSESSVADDALFEMALYYETEHDYTKAITKYKQLAEQYPYGVSITNNQEFREISREQISLMEKEINQSLELAGIKGGSIESRLLKVQKKYSLPQTGLPDQRTLQRVADFQNKIETAKKQKERKKAVIGKCRRIAELGIGIMLLLLIWTWVTSGAVRDRKKSVQILKRSTESL